MGGYAQWYGALDTDIRLLVEGPIFGLTKGRLMLRDAWQQACASQKETFELFDRIEAEQEAKQAQAEQTQLEQSDKEKSLHITSLQKTLKQGGISPRWASILVGINA